MRWNLGDGPTAFALFEESMALSRTLGDRRGLAEGLVGLHRIAWAQGDAMAAQQYMQESEALSRQFGDYPQVACGLVAVGDSSEDMGDDTAARRRSDGRITRLRHLEDDWGGGVVLDGSHPLGAGGCGPPGSSVDDGRIPLHRALGSGGCVGAGEP